MVVRSFFQQKCVTKIQYATCHTALRHISFWASLEYMVRKGGSYASFLDKNGHIPLYSFRPKLDPETIDSQMLKRCHILVELSDYTLI